MRCEHLILSTHDNNIIRCEKTAVYEIVKISTINNNHITTSDYLCSKHAETQYPFTKLKRIDYNNAD